MCCFASAQGQKEPFLILFSSVLRLSAEYPISSEAACDFGRLVKREKIKFNKCYAGLSGGAVSFLQSTLSSNPWCEGRSLSKADFLKN